MIPTTNEGHMKQARKSTQSGIEQYNLGNMGIDQFMVHTYKVMKRLEKRLNYSKDCSIF